MIKKKFLYVLVFATLLIPTSIKASCTTSEKARLKNLVSNVNISYDYEITKGRAIFSLRFDNVNSEIYFKDQNGNSYYGNENGEVILYNYSSGNSYTFDFYGIESCKSENIGKLYATIPSYNQYYSLSVCSDAQEFSLCQKWVSHSLSRSEFIKRVNEYKNETNNKQDDNTIDKDISVIDFTISFIKNYGIYILIIISVTIIVVKYIRYKKDSFGF